MKFKTFLLALFLLAGTATAFAGTNDKVKDVKIVEKAKTVKVVEPKKEKKGLWFQSCTVTVKSSKGTATVTVACGEGKQCTDTQLCDAAYAFAKALVVAS